MIHFMAFSSTNSHFYGAFLHKLCIIALILSPFFLLGCGPSAELDSKAGGAVTAESAMIAFDYVVLDTVFGHREVGDIDRDGLNDIVVGQNGEVNGKNRVYWYRSPDRERYLIADIDSHPGFNAYRACDMELADLDADGDLDDEAPVQGPRRRLDRRARRHRQRAARGGEGLRAGPHWSSR